ncbi:RnfABCDGE type electron transport complex subunit B [Shigella flexneri]
MGYASRRFAVEDDPVVEKIDEILPQSQCGQCGYPGCRPTRKPSAVTVKKSTGCAPGGEAVMLKIAELLMSSRSRWMAKCRANACADGGGY